LARGEPEKAEPQGMQNAGMEMHKAGSRFAIEAKNVGVTGEAEARFRRNHRSAPHAAPPTTATPVASLIAEVWDAAGLYQIGHFPGDRWGEWNGRCRDTIRRFVRGEAGIVGQVADAIAGSANLYQARGGLPTSSINFVTCHDGFTLNDLVSYNGKHNVANGEGNNDGELELWH
jgi:pullulanase/glycogen debranching enzyme